MVAVRGVRHGSGPGSQLGSIQRVVLVAIVMVVAVMLFSYTTSYVLRDVHFGLPLYPPSVQATHSFDNTTGHSEE